jgi:hypothetical protein
MMSASRKNFPAGELFQQFYRLFERIRSLVNSAAFATALLIGFRSLACRDFTQ